MNKRLVVREEKQNGNVWGLYLKISRSVEKNLINEVQRHLSLGHKKIIFDLSKVARMNSSHLGSILWARDSIRGNVGNLKLVGIQKETKRLLAITKLEDIFDIYETEKEALESFKQGEE
ncbi:MAG: STAS domain-containing protein [Patescibacteria group bacterium]|nr:STAS domain-containing protein [Patescibacteria group bacterium]